MMMVGVRYVSVRARVFFFVGWNREGVVRAAKAPFACAHARESWGRGAFSRDGRVLSVSLALGRNNVNVFAVVST